jgi:hypothetical protein
MRRMLPKPLDLTAMFVVCLFAIPCYGQGGKLPNPVLNSGAPWYFTGFTIESPDRIEGATGWFSFFKTSEGTTLAAQKSASHTYVVTVKVGTMAKVAPDAAALAAILKEGGPALDERRYSLKQYVETPEPGKGVCSRSARRVMDGSPDATGAPRGWLAVNGLTCVYPHNPKIYVSVEYSERGGGEEFSPAMKAAGEKVLSSFRFMQWLRHPERASMGDVIKRGDHAEIRALLTPIASAGDGYAAMLLGDSFYLAKDDLKDVALARKWYEMAASQGLPRAQSRLASMLERTGEMDHAIRWYKRAADQRDADAQFLLSGSYREGKGVAKDEKAAWNLVRMAADNGNPFAKMLVEKPSPGGPR